MKSGFNRREVVVGASLLFCGACAAVPGRSERLPQDSKEPAADRACDHELCRYWKPTDAAAPVDPEAFRVGRCSIGLPEGM